MSFFGDWNFVENKAILNIVGATPKDLSRVNEIESMAFISDRFSGRKLRYLLLKANSIFKVGFYDSTIVGYYILLKRSACAHTRLYSLAVDPSFQGLSFGKQLMIDAESETFKLRLTHLRLEVRSDNQVAIRLYQDQGFESIREIPNYYQDLQSAIVMAKHLPPNSD
jgi:ribosomal-protein-alanine N-acetyltransferase